MSALASAQKPALGVRLTNRVAVFDVDPDDYEAVSQHFQYRPPNYRFTYGYINGGDGYKKLMQRSRVAAGLFLDRLKELEKKFIVVIKDERTSMRLGGTDRENYLRPYQQEAVEAMTAASKTGGLILNATGTGKTRIAGAYFRRVSGPCVFVCDELALMEQSRRSIEETLGEEVGTVGNSKFAPRRVTVATVQTLAKHSGKPEFKRWFETITAMIIDEVHVALNKRNIDVVRSVKPLAVFGLTATLEIEKPWVRLPALALTGPVLFTYTMEQGVKEGYLAAGVIVRLRFEDPLTGVAPAYKSLSQGTEITVAAGSKAAEYRHHVVLNKRRNDMIEAVVREGVKRGRRAVVLVEQKAHLAVLSSRLRDLRPAVLSGAVDSEDRLAAMKRMDAGKLDVIIASRVFSKGVDVQSVSLIVDATALPGSNGAVQRYGRGARKDGDKVLLYVDVSDSGSDFEGAAKSRMRALRSTGSPMVEIKWKGEASSVFDAVK